MTNSIFAKRLWLTTIMNKMVKTYYERPHFRKNYIEDLRIYLTTKEISEAMNFGIIPHLMKINDDFEIDIKGKWLPFRVLNTEEIQGEIHKSTDQCIKQRRQYILNISSTHAKSTKIATIVWQNVLRFESVFRNIINAVNIRLIYSTETILHHLSPTIFPATDVIKYNEFSVYQAFLNKEMNGILKITKLYYFYTLLELFKIHSSQVQSIRVIDQYRQDHQLYIQLQEHDCNKLIQYYKSNNSDLQYFECVGGLTQILIFNIIDEYINHLEHDEFINKVISCKIHSLASSPLSKVQNINI